jgi:N-acetylglucosaminyldiphosphoundecaprenol N-acetyl-beta-D-mannosaminyltransferase
MIFNKLIKNESEVLKLVENALSFKNNLLLTYLNQHCFNIYNSNRLYRDLLDKNFNIFLDGIGIYWTLKLFGYRNIEKFNATDLNEKLLEYFSQLGTRIYLIGGMFDENFLSDKLFKKNINLAGYNNGFFNDQNIDSITNKIDSTSAEVIIIGMGVPKQELFADRISRSVRCKIIICVGNFFEFYLGTKKRGPEFFRNIGLEWLFRLKTEPKRLWKRYIVGIPLFFYNVLKMKLGLDK